MVESICVHLIIAKRVIRYPKGTLEYGLRYESDQKINLHGYVDLDWARSGTDRKSTIGCRFNMGSRVIS